MSKGQERIAVLEAAILDTWEQYDEDANPYCVFCGAACKSGEQFIHDPDCVVLTIAGWDKSEEPSGLVIPGWNDGGTP